MSTAEPQLNATETAPSNSETVEKHKEFLFPAVAMYYQEPLALVRGEGEYVWDDEGNRYLDCFGGVLTVSVGHCQPEGQRGDHRAGADDRSTPRRSTPTSRSPTWPRSSPRSRPAV